MKIGWNEFKEIVDSRGMDIILIELSVTYYLYASEQNINLECQIIKETEEATSFEATHLSKCNKKRNDSENTSLVRLKYCNLGWSYISKTFQLETSNVAGLFTQNYNSPCTSLTAKYLKEDLTECADQADADLYCTITQVDFYPSFTYELMGGRVLQKTTPAEPVRVFVRAAPDISSAYGGSKDFITNFNLEFLGPYYELVSDGRASKQLTYVAGTGASKLRFHFKHSAGFKHRVQVSLELFRA